jgi:hypothetical protein
MYTPTQTKSPEWSFDIPVKRQVLINNCKISLTLKLFSNAEEIYHGIK